MSIGIDKNGTLDPELHQVDTLTKLVNTWESVHQKLVQRLMMIKQVANIVAQP